MPRIADITDYAVLLRTIRMRAGESQETMATRYGKSRTWLANIELGVSPVPAGMTDQTIELYGKWISTAQEAEMRKIEKHDSTYGRG